MNSPSYDPRRNGLLGALSEEDLRVLSAHLEFVSLDKRHVLERPGEDISQIYFPLSGLGSIVAVGSRLKDQRIEAGIFGRDGMSGTSILLGARTAVHEVYIQLPGKGLRLPTDALREAMETRPAIRTRLLNYVHVLQLQITHTALANGRDHLETRLARWLLMAHDRVEGDSLDLTHEFLSLMLGVRRPGVTTTLHALEGRGLVKTGRGTIDVIDRDGLIETANGSYGTAETEYERMIGHPL